MVPVLPAPAAWSSSPVASASPAVPKEPEIPALKPAENPSYVLAETDIDLASSIPLRIDDSPAFAHAGKGRKVEVRLASPRSTASVSTDERDLIGNVKVEDISIRPKVVSLVDGFVRIRQAHLKPLAGATGRYVLGFALPSHVKAEREPHVEVACGDVSLARSTGPSRPAVGSKPIYLRTGVPIDLRSTPGGTKVATILLPNIPGNVVQLSARIDEVERKGSDVKLLMRGDGSEVEGWISAKDLAKPPSSASMGLLGMLGGGGIDVEGPKELAVSREMPLYARRGSRTVRVGTVGSGTLTCVSSKVNSGEVAVGLDGSWPFGGLGGLGRLGSGEVIGGLGGSRVVEEEPVTTFVKPTAGETCVVTEKKDIY